MSTRDKVKVIAIIAIVLAFLLFNPYTRQLILFILPLGSGVDDLVFFITLAIAIGGWITYNYLQREKAFKCPVCGHRVPKLYDADTYNPEESRFVVAPMCKSCYNKYHR